ncbi:MAG: TonB-dependent receptor, partial [Pseudoxanthomonas sp.]
PTAALVDLYSGGPGRGVNLVPDPSRRLAYTNDSTEQEITDQGISGELNWVTPWLGGATLTSISSIRKWDLQSASDLDFSGGNFAVHDFSPQNGQAFKVFTQELRLAGSTDRVDWMGGLYFDDVKLHRAEAIDLKPDYEKLLSTLLISGLAGALPPGLINTANPQNFLAEAAGVAPGTAFIGRAQQDRWNQDSTSSAAFGNATFHITDDFDITGGARFTHEKKQTQFNYSNPNGGTSCLAAISTNGIAAALAARGVPASVIPALVPTVIGNMCLPWQNPLFNGLKSSDRFTENEWSGTLKGSYRFNEEVMVYLSGARGFKAGGFNLARAQSSDGTTSGGSGIRPVTDTQFPGEFANSFELGTKTTWAGGNLLINAALFHAKYTDYQVNTFSGISWFVLSMPKLTTQGLDLDLLWKTEIPGLSVQAAATYTDAQFGNKRAPNDPNNVLILLPGATASFAPKWAASLGGAYQWDVGTNLSGRFNLGLKYTQDYNTSGALGDVYVQDGYTLVDGRLSIGARNDRWRAELWGVNLTNRTYAQVKYPPALQTGSVNAFLGAPRTYGVTLHVAL